MTDWMVWAVAIYCIGFIALLSWALATMTVFEETDWMSLLLWPLTLPAIIIAGVWRQVTNR